MHPSRKGVQLTHALRNRAWGVFSLEKRSCTGCPSHPPPSRRYTARQSSVTSILPHQLREYPCDETSPLRGEMPIPFEKDLLSPGEGALYILFEAIKRNP